MEWPGQEYSEGPSNPWRHYSVMKISMSDSFHHSTSTALRLSGHPRLSLLHELAIALDGPRRLRPRQEPVIGAFVKDFAEGGGDD
jgi:hypothetical protein